MRVLPSKHFITGSATNRKRTLKHHYMPLNYCNLKLIFMKKRKKKVEIGNYCNIFNLFIIAISHLILKIYTSIVTKNY